MFLQIFEKLEHKLSNLICKTCKSRIIEFYEFKKQCGINIEILLQVKNELDRSVGKDIPKKTDDNDILDSVESPSEDKIEECSEKKAISRKSRTTKSKSASKKSLKGSQCSICGKIVIGISMHMMIHSGTKKFSCQYCPKTFTQSGQLKRHVNSHLDIRNYECPVSGCERKFVDPSSVTKHLVIHNKDDRKFQCSLCGSRFNRLGALRYHEKTHRQERNHHCDLCNKSFLGKEF